MQIIMVTADKCYFETPYESLITMKLYLACQMAKDSDWVKYYNFELLPINHETLRKADGFLKALYHAHPYEAGVIRLQPNTYYDWHVDDRRGVSVNMLINHGHSHCLFKKSSNTLEDAVTGKFYELNYQRGIYYFFNNQVEHSVYNYEGVRYLLTLEFHEDKDKLNFKSLTEEWRNGRWRKRQQSKANK